VNAILLQTRKRERRYREKTPRPNSGSSGGAILNLAFRFVEAKSQSIITRATNRSNLASGSENARQQLVRLDNVAAPFR